LIDKPGCCLLPQQHSSVYFPAVKIMQTPKTRLHINCAAFTVLMSLALLGASSCTQKSSSAAVEKTAPDKTAAAENLLTSNPTNPRIAAAQKTIEKAPDSANGYNNLAAAYISLARETGDFNLNSKAEASVARALEIEPGNLSALKLKASLMLTFHRFAEARDFAVALQQKYPNDEFFYGALTDAFVELGDYERAVETAQKMVDLRPDMQSYARVAHLRSLYGDSRGAIEAMSLAARVADPGDREAQAWCLTRLGDEHFKNGDFAAAEKSYDAALGRLPAYHLALAGKGRARAAQNDFEGAIKFLTESQTRVPLAETVIGLGDVYARTGNAEKAAEQYKLAEVIEGNLGDASDRSRLALLWADRNEKLDEALAIARREHEERRDIFTADILAWCLAKKGDFVEAKKAMAEAMRLKTKDARFFYHAGMIEKGLGNRQPARQLLRQALQTNPAFDFIQAEKAREALNEL
jgi:tetratricopeptide (TPR) repeat protein